MKLAEALQERADLNRRVQQLRQRLVDNAIVQEKEKPAEDPKELLKELNGCLATLEELMGRINLTNCQTMVEGKTLTECIARRDTLSLKISSYRDLASAASQTGLRATRTDIKLLSTVDVKDLQKQVDALSKELRLLDNQIQSTNWTTELL